MILKEAKVQKRNLYLSLFGLLLVVAWIVFFDPSFSETRSHVLTGMAIGYLGFAIFDYRNPLHQIFQPANPNRRRTP